MKDRLTTSSYCFILAANFLLYFGFWLLIPVLPFYLSEFFQAENSTIGIVLSCYTVAALCIRPFSGYLLDTFARKPLYLFAYFIFMMMFGGYLIAGSLTLFIMFRIIHGVSFGMVTVGGNTVVIDIMPSSRRGEGLGYYGLTNNTAMSIGPMFGLFLHDAGVSFATIFCYAFGACILGFLSASLVKTPYKPPVKREPISLDRFILLKGMPAGLRRALGASADVVVDDGNNGAVLTGKVVQNYLVVRTQRLPQKRYHYAIRLKSCIHPVHLFCTVGAREKKFSRVFYRYHSRNDSFLQ